MSERVAVVTGSNTGIGLAIVTALCKRLGETGVVYLTSRNEGRGKDAVELLKKEGLSPRLQILDVDDKESIEKLCDYVKSEHGGLDILINNAGILYKDSDPTPMSVQAEKTIATNYFALLNVTNAFLPIIRSGGRVVHVASVYAPMTYNQISEELRQRFIEASTEQAVSDLMNEFVEAVKAGNHVQKGWADSAYGTSKLGVIAVTRIQGREISKDRSRTDILINSCCPGYVKTNMTAHFKDEKGRGLTPDQGADNPIHLSLLPPATTELQGIFMSKRQVMDFFNKDIKPVSF